MCLVLFATWMLLPACGCQLAELLGKEVAAQSFPSEGHPAGYASSSDDSCCHCHESHPTLQKEEGNIARVNGPSNLALIFSNESEDVILKVLVAAAQSSRAPPSSIDYLGPAEGRTYLAHCAFLL